MVGVRYWGSIASRGREFGMDGLEAWGRGGKGVDLETLGLDAASWLEGNGVFTTQEVRADFAQILRGIALS